jgi:hypothetical protein
MLYLEGELRFLGIDIVTKCVRRVVARVIVGTPFRCWYENAEAGELERQIRSFVDGQEFSFFIEKDGDIYAASESSRMIFANMKNPAKAEMPKGWEDEASFVVCCLSRLFKGDSPQSVFEKRDLPSLTVIDEDEAIKKLKKQFAGKTIKTKSETVSSSDE